MASSNSEIDKPQHGRPKRAELLDVNINTGVQSIKYTESLFKICTAQTLKKYPNWNPHEKLIELI